MAKYVFSILTRSKNLDFKFCYFYGQRFKYFHTPRIHRVIFYVQQVENIKYQWFEILSSEAIEKQFQCFSHTLLVH
jgi:hypothetical protein